MKTFKKIIAAFSYIKESIVFMLYKKEHMKIYDLDYDLQDPILKTAIRNRKRRIVKFVDVY